MPFRPDQRAGPLRRAIVAARLFLLAAFAGPVLAAAPSGTACTDGVWSGTVGTAPITLNLTPDEAGGPGSGSYYYRAELSDLVLLPEGQPGEWREIGAKGRITGRLHLTCDAQTLEGRWTPAAGGRPIPIRARRIADDQYHTAREANLRPIATPHQEGVGRYETLTLPVPDANGEVLKEYGSGIQGVRLLGADPGLLRINAELRAQWMAWLREHLDCIAYGRVERSPDAAFHTSGVQSVLAWTPEQVAISLDSDAYCGGNHPMTSHEVRIYRPQTGEAVDAGSWIAATLDQPAPDEPTDPDEGPSLRQLLDRMYEPDNGDAECKDSIRWSVLFARPGELVFRAEAGSYGMRMCNGDWSLPLERAWRFLSPDGERDLAAFRRVPAAPSR